MFGIVVVTHGTLGTCLLETVALITSDRLEDTVSVSIGSNDGSQKIKQQILGGIKTVQKGSGVLILTDMFGGTPSNLSLPFLDENYIEVLTGVNIPILIKALAIRKDTPLADAAPTIESYGKRSISLASSILGPTGRKGSPKKAKK